MKRNKKFDEHIRDWEEADVIEDRMEYDAHEFLVSGSADTIEEGKELENYLHSYIIYLDLLQLVKEGGFGDVEELEKEVVRYEDGIPEGEREMVEAALAGKSWEEFLTD